MRESADANNCNIVHYTAPTLNSDVMQKLFYQAKFTTSAAKLSQCVDDIGAEVAFAGRSNAGKSSAINRITNQKALARTSKTPGRTQLINFFELNDEYRIVDLPGYGFAKVPGKLKAEWGRLIDDYLRERKSLRGVVLMMDVRNPMTEFDQQMLSWAAEVELPVHILLTKADKLKFGAAKNSLFAVKKQMEDIGARATIQLFSSKTGSGLEEAHQQISTWLESERKT